METEKILAKNAATPFLTATEKSLLQAYLDELTNGKSYYEKANLNFVRGSYPLILKKAVSQETQFLYSEILRINPALVTTRLGNELLINKIQTP